jgi:hypothetical protein
LTSKNTTDSGARYRRCRSIAGQRIGDRQPLNLFVGAGELPIREPQLLRHVLEHQEMHPERNEQGGQHRERAESIAPSREVGHHRCHGAGQVEGRHECQPSTDQQRTRIS